MVDHAKAINSERVVLVGPDIASDEKEAVSAVFAAAAVAGVIAGILTHRYQSTARNDAVRGGG